MASLKKPVLFLLFLLQILSCINQNKSKDKKSYIYNVDEIEPNNNMAEAQSVKHSTFVKGFINKVMDQDWYKINIPADSSAILRAEISGIPDINLDIELYDSDKNQLLDVNRYREGEGEVLTNYKLKPGNTYLRIKEFWIKNTQKKSNDSISYNLKVKLLKIASDVEIEPNNKAVNSTILMPNIPTKGYISPYEDKDWYKLSISNQYNKYLKINLSGLEKVNLKLKVYDPIEAIIDQSDRGDKADEEIIPNLGIEPEKEFYYIVVEGDRWQTNEDQTYKLTAKFIDKSVKMEFEPNDRLVKATELKNREKIFGLTDDIDDVDWYHIINDSSDIQVARIELKGIPRIDFKMTLTNELEEAILSVNEKKVQENEIITNIGLDSSKNLYIKLEPVNKAANLSDLYSIFLSINPHQKNEELELNDSKETANIIEFEKAIAGYIHPIGDVDYYKLELANHVSGELEIILEGIMKVNTNIILYDEEMNEIGKAASKPAEDIERLRFEAVPGTYYIKIYDNDGKESNYRDKYKLAIFNRPSN